MTSSQTLKVALIGSRGIPAAYGGYETLLEELSWRLVDRGFRITVYCRSHYTPAGLTEHRGAQLAILPTIPTKYLDTPVHTLFACLHAAARGYDVALVVNSANSIFVPWLQLFGTPVALHVDGIEKKRAKWGGLGRAIYALSERLATGQPDLVITDAETIRQHYVERYRKDSKMIAYGVDPKPLVAGPNLKKLGLESRGYFLYVSRFEPENNPHKVVEAYSRVGGNLPLVMVGSAPYASGFVQHMKYKADRRILFPGAIYGDGYRELLSHALAYIQATEIGGTHPALVEAMGYENCVVVNDTAENREVVGDTGLYFQVRHPSSLAAALEQIRANPKLREEHANLAANRARNRYSWDSVADEYAKVLSALAVRN